MLVFSWRSMPKPAATWSWRGRAAVVGGALLATFPVWPGVQPGEPVADELLPPAEVALLVPIVLLFPLAWALLGGRRRPGLAVGAVLVLAVGVWAGGTVTLAGYGTPPSVDDSSTACRHRPGTPCFRSRPASCWSARRPAASRSPRVTARSSRPSSGGLATTCGTPRGGR
ncbi:hypothetical protein [Phytohabitans houttuyneae]|uniref:hypothetical protein n=1 Tax=Phytohabitans houttuyneae TaxID=1076126 RepID=UPI0015651F10